MASTTIHTLSYKMIADTQNFSRGVLATKSEVQLLKKILGDTTPEQKAEKAFERVNNLFDKGKITAKQQAEAIKAIHHEMVAAQRAGSKFYQTIDKVQASVIRIGKAGLGAAAAGVGILGYNIQAEIGNMKGLADAAADLQMNFNDLVRLQQAFIRGGEVSGDVVIPALRSMSEKIQEAARNQGELKNFAAELNLEMDTMFALSKMPVLDQFRVVVEQISKLPDQGSKGLIVKKLFGTDENKLTTLLGGGLENLDKIAATADRFGMTLQDGSVDAVRKLVGQTEQLQDRWTGLVRKLSVELLPILNEIVSAVQVINRWLGNEKGPGVRAITGPGGKVLQGDPTLRAGARSLNEFMMIQNFTNAAARIDPTFSIQSAMSQKAMPNTPAGQVAMGAQTLASGVWRTGNKAKDEEIMQALLSQLTDAMRRNAEATEQANEQRNREESRIE